MANASDFECITLSAARQKLAELTVEEEDHLKSLNDWQKELIDNKLAKSEKNVDNSLHDFFFNCSADISKNHEYVLAKVHQEGLGVARTQKAFSAAVELAASIESDHSQSCSHLASLQNVNSQLSDWLDKGNDEESAKVDAALLLKGQSETILGETSSDISTMKEQFGEELRAFSEEDDQEEFAQQETQSLLKQIETAESSAGIRDSEECELEREIAEMTTDREEENVAARMEEAENQALQASEEDRSRLEQITNELNSTEWSEKETKQEDAATAEKIKLEEEKRECLEQLSDLDSQVKRQKMRLEVIREMMDNDEAAWSLPEWTNTLQEISYEREGAYLQKEALRVEKENLEKELIAVKEMVIHVRMKVTEEGSDTQTSSHRLRTLQRRRAEELETWKINIALAERRHAMAAEELKRIVAAPLDSFEEVAATPAVHLRKLPSAAGQTKPAPEDSDDDDIIDTSQAAFVPVLKKRNKGRVQRGEQGDVVETELEEVRERRREVVYHKVSAWRQSPMSSSTGQAPGSYSSGRGSTDSTACLVEHRFRPDIFLNKDSEPMSSVEKQRNLDSTIVEVDDDLDNSVVYVDASEAKITYDKFFQKGMSPPPARSVIPEAPAPFNVPSPFDESFTTDQSIWSQNGF